MTKHEYIEDNAKWIGESGAAALERVPDALWCAVLAATQIAGGTDPGIDCGLVVTHETLADFDDARNNHWRECGKRTEHALDGCAALQFERFQLVKGAPRESCMVVVDLGDFRLALT